MGRSLTVEGTSQHQFLELKNNHEKMLRTVANANSRIQLILSRIKLEFELEYFKIHSWQSVIPYAVSSLQFMEFLLHSEEESSTNLKI